MPKRARLSPPPRPTIVCPLCHGTGLNRARAFAHVQGRAAVDDTAREAAVRCAGCDGRGRQLVGPAAGFPPRR